MAETHTGNFYECLMILDANAYARDPGGASTNIAQLVENCGGTLLASRLWNEQKLAYPINGRYKGAYWLTYFEMPGEQVSKFNRTCDLADLIMRHLVVKIDPRLVDTLVAAAKGERPVAAETETETKPEKPSGADGSADQTPAQNSTGDAVNPPKKQPAESTS